jgi:hypothetical protein
MFKLIVRLYKWLMWKQEMSIVKPQINNYFADPINRDKFISKMDSERRKQLYNGNKKRYKTAPTIE